MRTQGLPSWSTGTGLLAFGRISTPASTSDLRTARLCSASSPSACTRLDATRALSIANSLPLAQPSRIES